MRARSLWARFAPALILSLAIAIASTAAGCGLSLDYDPQDPARSDAGQFDAGARDGAIDAGDPDPDPDAGTPDAGAPDGGELDSGSPGECVGNLDCDDGAFCNGEEHCVDATCVPGTPMACPDEDGIACTVPICSADADGCSEIPTSSLCTDPNPDDCMVPRCGPTGCTMVANDTLCADPFDCTVDACRPSAPGVDPTGCVHAPDATRCSDDVACTLDACNPSAPLHDALGCVHRPDDNLCSPSGSLACGALLCVGAEALAADPSSMGCAPTLDSTRCALTAHCVSRVSGPICASFEDGCGADSDCSDGNECNGREQCVGGRCMRATAGCPPVAPCLESWCDTSTNTCRTRRDPTCGGFGG